MVRPKEQKQHLTANIKRQEPKNRRSTEKENTIKNMRDRNNENPEKEKATFLGIGNLSKGFRFLQFPREAIYSLIYTM